MSLGPSYNGLVAPQMGTLSAPAASTAPVASTFNWAAVGQGMMGFSLLSTALMQHFSMRAASSIARIQGQTALDIAYIQAGLTEYLADVQSSLLRDLAAQQATTARVIGQAQGASAQIIAKAQETSWTTDAQTQRLIGAANAAIAIRGAETVMESTQQAIAIAHQKLNLGIGYQIASAAGQGIDPHTGSQRDLRDQAIDLNQVERQNLAINGARHALGFELGAKRATLNGELLATSDEYKAQVARISGENLPRMFSIEAEGKAKGYEIAGRGQANLIDMWGGSQATLLRMGGRGQQSMANYQASYYDWMSIAGPLSSTMQTATNLVTTLLTMS